MPLPFSWFCYVIFLLYVGFYLIYSLSCRVSIKLMLLTAYVLAVSVFLRMGLGFGSHWYVSNLTLVVGAVIGTLEEKSISEYVLSKKNICGLLTIVCTAASIIWFVYAPKYGLPQLLVVFVTFLPIVVILLTHLFFYPSGVLSFLGKISYEVYLVHGIVIWALSKLQMSAFLYVSTVLAMAIIFGYLGNKLNQAIFRVFRL